MTIRLDHTIVPVRDKAAAAEFFASVFGLTVKPGFFAQVQVNDSLTLDFDDRAAPRESHHYAFHVSDAEYDEIWGRVKAMGLAFGSGPHEAANGRTYARRGGRGFYFEDLDGHMLEVMTVPETGS